MLTLEHPRVTSFFLWRFSVSLVCSTLLPAQQSYHQSLLAYLVDVSLLAVSGCHQICHSNQVLLPFLLPQQPLSEPVVEKYFTVNLLHIVVSLKGQSHGTKSHNAGTQVAQWDSQNTATCTSPPRVAFVLEVHQGNLHYSICDFAPCDQIMQRAHSTFMFIFLSACKRSHIYLLFHWPHIKLLNP